MPEQRTGVRRRLVNRLLPVTVMAAMAGGVLVPGGPSSAAVVGVTGSATGSQGSASINIGGPGIVQNYPPTPTVTLPPGGSATPLTATGTGDIQIGPARLFTSDPITVTTGGTAETGPVTSTSHIPTDNKSGVEILTATAIDSTCTASEGTVAGSTTITNGTLQTDNGDTDHPPVKVGLPLNPAPTRY